MAETHISEHIVRASFEVVGTETKRFELRSVREDSAFQEWQLAEQQKRDPNYRTLTISMRRQYQPKDDPELKHWHMPIFLIDLTERHYNSKTGEFQNIPFDDTFARDRKFRRTFNLNGDFLNFEMDVYHGKRSHLNFEKELEEYSVKRFLAQPQVRKWVMTTTNNIIASEIAQVAGEATRRLDRSGAVASFFGRLRA